MLQFKTNVIDNKHIVTNKLVICQKNVNYSKRTEKTFITLLTKKVKDCAF